MTPRKHYVAEAWRDLDGSKVSRYISAMDRDTLLEQVTDFLAEHDPSGVDKIWEVENGEEKDLFLNLGEEERLAFPMPRGKCEMCGDYVRAEHRLVDGGLAHTRTAYDSDGQPYPDPCGPINPERRPQCQCNDTTT